MTTDVNDTTSMACENTDRELYRESNDAYAYSVFVTKDGAIGMNCGGHVIVKSIKGWHLSASGGLKYDKERRTLVPRDDGAVNRASTVALPTCAVTGRIAGDGFACGDCDPCGAAHMVPDVVKRLIAERDEWADKYASAMEELGERSSPVAAPSREWCEQAARDEAAVGDPEIGAGALARDPSSPVNRPEAAEVERLRECLQRFAVDGLEQNRTIAKLLSALKLGREAVVESFDHAQTLDDKMLAEGRLRDIDDAIAAVETPVQTSGLPAAR